MIEFLKLSEEQRRGIIGVIDYTQGIPEKAVEKDWWVTLTLKALFTCEYAPYIVFKGGTSLSKCWKLIERFSEDIDIALNSEAFDVKYEESPSKSYVNNLKKKACAFTSNELKSSLEKQLLAFGVPAELFTIEADAIDDKMPDKDPQTLFLKYKSLFEPNNYLADQVKIEISARSQNEPAKKVKILSFVGESPNVQADAYKEEPLELTAVEPQRTFLEKAFLLHEEFKKTDKAKIKAERMSRHLYDLERMMNHETGKKALADKELYDSIVKHREKYSRLGWVDYATLDRDTISFVPPDEFLTLYESDYKSMREQMIYGEAPEFKELIKRLRKLNNRFRTKPVLLEEVKIQPEFSPYHFFKNETQIKSETWNIDLGDKFRLIRLHNFTIADKAISNNLLLKIKIENSLHGENNIDIPFNQLTSMPQHENTLFFIARNQNYLDIELRQGRNWVTFKIIELNYVEEYDMKLSCDYF